MDFFRKEVKVKDFIEFKIIYEKFMKDNFHKMYLPKKYPHKIHGINEWINVKGDNFMNKKDGKINTWNEIDEKEVEIIFQENNYFPVFLLNKM